jgi:hypothetical protein
MNNLNKSLMLMTGAMVSVVCGKTYATDSTSIAYGTNASATTYSVAIGYGSTASTCSVALGYNAGAYCTTAVAIGYGSHASVSDVSLGLNSKNYGYYSTAIGCGNAISSSTYYSCALGYNLTISSSNQYVIGEYNAVESDYTNSSGTSVTPFFIIADGTSSVGSNIFAVYTDGSAKVPGDLVVGGKINSSSGTLLVSKIGVGVTSVDSDSNLDVNGGLSLGTGSRNVTVNSTYAATGNQIMFADAANVTEDFIGYINNTFYFVDSTSGTESKNPNVVMPGTLTVGKTSTGGYTLTVAGTIYSSGAGSFGSLTSRGAFTANGNATVNGTLTSTGAITASSTLAVTGSTSVGGALTVSGDIQQTGNDFMFGSNTDRGNGGRALVHDSDDTLTINYAGDFGALKLDGVVKIVNVQGDISMGAFK